MKNKLFLIPTPLAEGEVRDVLADKVLNIIKNLSCFVVEDLRTARRFLSKAGLRGNIESLELFELNEHSSQSDIEALVPLLEKGNLGLLSEAGLPAVADPGAKLVELAHIKGHQVVPLVGPCSLMLALMASGLNGQCFAFHGYLPIKTEERKAKLKELEKISASLGQSQIFIETPYRNDSMIKELLASLKDSTRLCAAINITAQDEEIISKEVGEWKKQNITLGKRPCVFVFLAQ